ncbi:hypothetical protein ACDZ29_19510 [Peribacillus sp. RS7]|uniref:hypothetical protein n=1 Tax=unclassified Peribacillus TaxID=2675266 RepID=UPI0025A17093|nr:hypothetical protein [Peribacillus sp. ACCC06369]MDM5358144.1 hypothetical protein [Peribacillus sp. ACCC06369]
MLSREKNNQIVIYIIKGSTIKKFLILDLIIGSGIFYVVKYISSSVLIASVSSFIGTEGIKKAPKVLKNAIELITMD